MVGLASAVVQGGVVRRLVPAMGERRAYLLGLGVAAVAFAGYGFAPTPMWVYVIIPIGALAGMIGPSVQAILSHGVPGNEQGMLQGGLTSLQSVSSILGPLLANGAFGYFVSDDAPVHLPGAAFFVGAVLWVVALLLSLRAFARHPVKSAPGAPVETAA
jgi:DHA1 family tetracycline resistance protein-like MFS transporter